MKIINENIENFEGAEPITNVMDPVTAEAIAQDKKTREAVKDLIDPKELAKKKPFIGTEKQETPKEVEVPKATLDESLFEEYVVEEVKHGFHVDAYVEGKPVEKVITAATEDAAKEKFVKNLQGVNANAPKIQSLNISQIPDDKYAETVKQYKTRNSQVEVESLTEAHDDIREKLYWFIQDRINEALDNVAIVAASEIPEYDADWALESYSEPFASREAKAMKALVNAEVDILLGQRDMDESVEKIVEEVINEDGRQNRAPNKTQAEKDEEDTLFDRVYKELSTDDTGYEVPAKHRFNAEMIEIWGDDDVQEITVRVPEHRKDRLQLVKDVADHFGLLSRIEKGIQGTYVGTVFIPEELYDETSEETKLRLAGNEESVKDEVVDEM